VGNAILVVVQLLAALLVDSTTLDISVTRIVRRLGARLELGKEAAAMRTHGSIGVVHRASASGLLPNGTNRSRSSVMLNRANSLLCRDKMKTYKTVMNLIHRSITTIEARTFGENASRREHGGARKRSHRPLKQCLSVSSEHLNDRDKIRW
jgi:hypothetical protein